jgi:hypothetical protein
MPRIHRRGLDARIRADWKAIAQTTIDILAERGPATKADDRGEQMVQRPLPIPECAK